MLLGTDGREGCVSVLKGEEEGGVRRTLEESLLINL
jgi:hypothetical protein